MELVSKYHQAILHQIDASRTYTLHMHKACDIRSARKYSLYQYFEHLAVISSQDSSYSTRCDCTVSYTHKSKCVITVGDCCRVFLLHMMYAEGVETVVIIWCWTSGQMAFCLAMHECLIHHNFTRIAAYACNFLLQSILKL